MAAKKKTKKKAKKKAVAKPKPKVTKKKVVAKPKPKPKKAKAKAPKKKTKRPAGILPTPEEEARFWSLIEDAWAPQGADVNRVRAALAKRTPPKDDDDDGDDVGEDFELIDESLDAVLERLRSVFAFEDFPQDELVKMDRVVERKLYDIDRSEVQEVTDGSDDGFLYARGFIVILGKAYYDAVNKNPKMAIMDAECEEMCYLPSQVHEERFGKYPETGSNISRESCSNSKGWPDL